MKVEGITSQRIATEKEVIEDILQGKKESFALLIQNNNQLLYRTGMSYLDNHSEVEDTMQVTYLKAFENIRGFSHQSSFRTWIVRIMINECLMLLRRKKKRIELIFEDFDSLIALGIADTTSIESRVENNELKNLLAKMILKIPQNYSIVFMLREIDGMATKEVANALGISEENVKVRFYRGKKMLKELLLSQAPEEVFSYNKKHCSALTNKVMSLI